MQSDQGANGAREIIRAMDAHEAACDMARRLKLDAEVRTMTGKWEESGQIVGWTKTTPGSKRCNTLVEVFISDLAAETREFDRFARMMEAKDAQIRRLEAELSRLQAVDAAERQP